VALCPLSLGSAGSRIEALIRCNGELSTYCAAATPRMLFNCWYTSPAPSVEGADNASRSVATVATFWLLRLLPHHGLACLQCRLALKRISQPGLPSHPLSGELVSILSYFLLDVVLWGVMSSLRMSRRLLREGCWCSGSLRPHWYGLKHRGLLRRWHSGKGSSGYHRVAHPQERGARTLALTRV
jgi:hypothetical protein